MYPLFLYVSCSSRRMRKWLFSRDEGVYDVRGSRESGHEAPPFQWRDVRNQDIGNQIDAGVADCIQKFTCGRVRHRSTEWCHMVQWLVEHTGC